MALTAITRVESVKFCATGRTTPSPPYISCPLRNITINWYHLLHLYFCKFSQESVHLSVHTWERSFSSSLSLVHSSMHLNSLHSDLLYSFLVYFKTFQFAMTSQSVKWLCNGLNSWGIGVWFLAGKSDFYLFCRVNIISGAHPDSYSAKSFPEDKIPTTQL